MGNMISYIEQYGAIGFDEMDFGEVDSLILSQVAYFVLDGYVSRWHKFNRTLREIATLPDARITQDTTLPSENKALLDAIGQSKRFGNLTLACYSTQTDEDTELQFAAVTVRIHPRLHYIAFRGTDISLVGWKEDFNLSFSKSIPSQLCAAKYLKQTARFLRGKLLVGGHSKGGNLAVYAAMHAPHGIQKRIMRIYNHDGPGFPTEVFESKAYKSIQSRICKTVPHSAIVGLLFADREPHTVIASKHFALLQHSPYTWEVKDSDFVRLQKVNMFSRFTNRTLHSWLAQMPTESRKAFVNTFYDILKATNATTYPELLASLKDGFAPMREKLKSLDPETRTMMQKALRALVKSGRAQLKLLIKKGENF